MTAGLMQRENVFTILASLGRSHEIPEANDVYGWLVGSWRLEVLHYKAVDVSNLRLDGEAHFGWVLEGRAIQDVWMMPGRANRTSGLGETNNMFGTTLRVWDPRIQAWHIQWTNPVTGHMEKQIGRRIGEEIVQVGRGQTGQRRAGGLRRLPQIHITGSAKRCCPTARPGDWRASSRPDASQIERPRGNRCAS